MEMIDLFSKTQVYSYGAYNQYVRALLDQNKATGPDNSEEKLAATRINLQRIRRLDKMAALSREIIAEVNALKKQWEWTLIIEGWCGDGGQIIPYINKIAALSDNISLNIILRDQNPEIMDNYLTNGTRSIPILICKDVESNRELGFWGSRPVKVLEWIEEFKQNNPDYTSEEFNHKLHLFYAKDRGKAINDDLLSHIQEWLKTD